MKNIKAYFARSIKEVDTFLDKILFPLTDYPPIIHQAMRYAIFSGGKRIRPILAITCAEAVGGKRRDALIPAAAIEMIHAYSLVHDDLPAMDDDDLRRGKPTVHKRFGEDIGILTGDALLTHAMGLLAQYRPYKRAISLITEICTAVGTKGMLGGQVVDMEEKEQKTSELIMDYINIHKTGKLIAVSCHAGAIAGGASVSKQKAIRKYGEHLGFVFQLIDDIIDNDGYVRVFGKKKCLDRANHHIECAKAALSKNIQKKNVLFAIADFVLERRV